MTDTYIRKIEKEEFLRTLETETYNPDKDKFVKKFLLPRANALDLWHSAYGYFLPSGELAGVIICTLGKREPKTANLQILFVFDKFQRQGIGRELVEFALTNAVTLGAKYFRLSAEKHAREFYEKLGVKFWGTQKSGTYLSFFRAEGSTFSEGVYDVEDNHIKKSITAPRVGHIVKFAEGVEL